MESTYKLDKYESLLRIESTAACGEIENIVNDKVSSVERDDSYVYISVTSGEEAVMTPEEYAVVCEDYNMTKITKGTKLRIINGSLGQVAFIMN